MTNSITANDVIFMMSKVSEKMIDSLDLLTDADKMGDGDHGIGMKRGFTAVLKTLDTLADLKNNDLKSVFMNIGKTLMMNAGGASGAIFGTMYRSGGENLKGRTELDSETFARFLKDGLDGVMARGKAKPGDKTVIDALFPAVKSSAQSAEDKKTLSETLKKAAYAAREGVEATKNMVATTGKAKTLGSRTIGHLDPGALSVSIMLETMSNWLENK